MVNRTHNGGGVVLTGTSSSRSGRLVTDCPMSHRHKLVHPRIPETPWTAGDRQTDRQTDTG